MNPVTELETARIDELLGAFRELQGQFDMVRERLRRADEHRNTVARRIYDRVRSDYDRELDAIRARLTPLRDEMERVHETLEAHCREAGAAVHAIEEELAEAEFRHRIGEHEPVAFDEMRHALDTRVAQARARQAALQSALDAIASAREAGTPAAAPVTPAPEEAVSLANVDVAAEATPVARMDDDDFSSLIVDEPPSLQRTYAVTPADETNTAAPAPETVAESPAAQTDMISTPEHAVEVTLDEPAPAPVVEATASEPAPEPVITAPEPAPPVMPAPRRDAFENPHAWVSDMGSAGARPERRARVSLPPMAPVRPVTPTDELESALAPLQASIATAERTRTPAPAANPAPAPMASLPSLVFVSGPHVGQAIALLPTTLTIGREHDNNVEIKDADVARYHARILRERDAFVVEDLNSSTGTFVNGERKNRAVLSHGDVIRVGQTELALDYEWTTDSR